MKEYKITRFNQIVYCHRNFSFRKDQTPEVDFFIHKNTTEILVQEVAVLTPFLLFFYVSANCHSKRGRCEEVRISVCRQVDWDVITYHHLTCETRRGMFIFK